MPQFDPSSPVNLLADGFWEAILEQNPTTATMYGDPRYDDRLEDPSPIGRGRARALAESTLAAANAIVAEDQSLEDRITLDMVQVICQMQIEQDDQRVDLLRPVDQMGGPQTLLPTLATFQPADTPERLERFLTRLRAYPAFMAANIELLNEGIASGLTAPRIVTERTIAQLERLLQTPPEESVVVTVAQVASEADRSRVLEVVRERCGAGRPGLPRRPPGRLPGGQPAGSRACGRRPTATPCTGPRSWPGRPSPWSRPTFTRSAWTSSSRSRSSAR